jgi:hypothetical protein|tara:strand:- start:332 stop:472 length:141 start_codon:yes stop_codon:yes gene_type:complete
MRSTYEQYEELLAIELENNVLKLEQAKVLERIANALDKMAKLIELG